jgi:hypothetical protein
VLVAGDEQGRVCVLVGLTAAIQLLQLPHQHAHMPCGDIFIGTNLRRCGGIAGLQDCGGDWAAYSIQANTQHVRACR